MSNRPRGAERGIPKVRRIPERECLSADEPTQLGGAGQFALMEGLSSCAICRPPPDLVVIG